MSAETSLHFTCARWSFLDLCPFFVAGVRLSGHFEVWNVVFCDMRRTSDTFSCFLHDIKTLAGVVDMRLFLVAGVVFGELGHVLKVLFCEAVVISIWHMMTMFRGRHGASETSTKKMHEA